ncbi:MAG TPA: diaminopimelate decarboxylase [bacterium]|nr:diaminopimelate decarboxylase [bacterium]HPO08126.1 diaminopimelate decarboxylase [bacterium]HQO33864.1 diaminopimelate decarboxylase [bacterium]HQQ00649.1 diaminopimelate decarboxylase [bacterium]
MNRIQLATYADRNGVLHGEAVDLREIADRFGTPTYVYSAGAILDAITGYRKGLATVPHRICYSMKANPCQAILRIMARQGVGADLTSVGEMKQALHAGIPAEQMVFSGVGKRRDEIEAGIDAGVLMFNLESPAELESIHEIAQRLGKSAGIAVRINPNIDAKTHPKISTGLSKNKFGIPTDQAMDLYQRARTMPGVEIRGIACHIGSSLMDSGPLLDACALMLDLRKRLIDEEIPIPYLDLGGGLGIQYHEEIPDSPQRYGERLRECLGDFDGTLILEPGRSLVGNAGVLLATVLYRKVNGERTFVILDAAMNDLIRPAMYGAVHEILPLAAEDRPTEIVDVVGPICETGDTFISQGELPRLEPGDHVAILSAGAYGMAMASQYNGRLRPAEVLIEGDRFRLVRKRESVEDLWRLDIEEE